MQLFIVGKRNSADEADKAWEFQGVFSDMRDAEAACASPLYFVGPATLDQALPDSTVEWLGAYYPKAA